MATVRLGRYEIEHYALPHLCMHCGAEAAFTKKITFSWCPWWVPLFSWPAIMLTKRLKMAVPLCHWHRWHFGGRILVILGGLFAWIGSLGLIRNLSATGPTLPWGRAVIVLSGIAWILCAVFITLTGIRPTKITDRHITLTRVSKEFITALEENRRNILI